jgi:A/G-specific adenine glycosylase
VALEKKLTKELPVKDKKIKVKKRYFNFLVIKTANNKTILTERTGKGIWQGLYQFPLIECEKTVNQKEIIDSEEFANLFPDETTLSLFNSKEIVHKLSHQHLYTQFWIVETKTLKNADILWENIQDFPVPVLIANFLKAFEIVK